MLSSPKRDFQVHFLLFSSYGKDYAQHIFLKHGISALRRARKTDNNRIARATGATIVNRTDELQESDVGTRCGLFEVQKIGDEYVCDENVCLQFQIFCFL